MKKTAVGHEPITLISEIEAAKYLGVKRRTLQDWRLAGHVEAHGARYDGPRYYQIGRAAMYTVSDLTAWAASRQVG